ncbi:hypothetical protein NQZ68_033459, partial [Dissostichus eleginoides]
MSLPPSPPPPLPTSPRTPANPPALSLLPVAMLVNCYLMKARLETALSDWPTRNT